MEKKGRGNKDLTGGPTKLWEMERVRERVRRWAGVGVGLSRLEGKKREGKKKTRRRLEK